MMKTLERISKIWPAIASICSLVAIVMVSYMAQAVDDHDRAEKPHANIVSAMAKISAKVDLLEQKQSLNQTKNENDHSRSDRAQERILDAIVRMDQKISDD